MFHTATRSSLETRGHHDEVSIHNMVYWPHRAWHPNYLDHGHHGKLSLQGKIPIVEPGIEPGTS